MASSSSSKDQPKASTTAAQHATAVEPSTPVEDKHEPAAKAEAKTMKCAFCGADKPVPATPGQETAEELCPGCGRGALPVVAAV